MLQGYREAAGPELEEKSREDRLWHGDMWEDMEPFLS